MWRRPAAARLVVAVAVAAGAAMGVLGGGPAAAQTQVTVAPASGPPGTRFVVSGNGFAALPVEIRWGGLSGPVIATATGPAFSVPAVVPADSPPNSHPVLAVVTNGNAVSTSSASFQVTAEDAAPAASTTTSTTNGQPPATSPGASIPRGEVGTPVRGGLAGGVDGGVDPDMAGTTTAGGTTAGGGGAGATSATATTVAAVDVPTPTVTVPEVAAAAPAGGQGSAAAPEVRGAGEASAAVAPARTSQSAGAVSNPALLLVGLGLVFAGGVFLAVRNRQRI